MATLKELQETVNATNVEETIAEEIVSRIAQGVPELTDFSPGAPHIVIAEAVAWGSALNLYYAQRIPEAIEEWILRSLFGASELPAQPAQANLVLTFSTPAPSGGRVIPAGTGFKSTSNLSFVTTSDYTFPAGTYGNEMVNGSYLYQVPVVCVTAGAIGNVGAGAINATTQSIVDLVSVTNPEPAYGGVDAETYDQMRTRIFSQPADNVLVSQQDYENVVTQELGGGAVYVISPQLPDSAGTPDPNWQPGKVRLAIIYPDGTPLTASPTLEATLESKSPLAPVEFVAPTIVSVNIDLSVIFDPSIKDQVTIATDVEQAVRGYLDPVNWEYWGQIPNKVWRSEVIAVIQNISGVVSVSLNQPTTDVDLRPLGWTTDSPYAAPQVGTYNATFTAK